LPKPTDELSIRLLRLSPAQKEYNVTEETNYIIDNLSVKSSPVVEHCYFTTASLEPGEKRQNMSTANCQYAWMRPVCSSVSKCGVSRSGIVRISCGVFDSFGLCETLHQVKGPMRDLPFEGILEARTRSER
jgi:hypothetical protein